MQNNLTLQNRDKSSYRSFGDSEINPTTKM